MATKGVVTLLPSASRTADGNSGNGLFIGNNSEAVVYLDITSATGTSPTLDIVIEDTIDGTNYDTVASFTQATGVSRQIKRINNLSRYLRVSYTFGGTTPDFTFSVRAYVK